MALFKKMGSTEADSPCTAHLRNIYILQGIRRCIACFIHSLPTTSKEASTMLRIQRSCRLSKVFYCGSSSGNTLLSPCASPLEIYKCSSTIHPPVSKRNNIKCRALHTLIILEKISFHTWCESLKALQKQCSSCPVKSHANPVQALANLITIMDACNQCLSPSANEVHSNPQTRGLLCVCQHVNESKDNAHVGLHKECTYIQAHKVPNHASS